LAAWDIYRMVQFDGYMNDI